MNRARGEEYVDTRSRCLRQCLPGPVDIRGNCARQTRDDRPPHGAGNRAHRLEVAVRGNREPSLDDVHTEPIELLCQSQLFGSSHAEAGSLLAVTERRVEHWMRDVVAIIGYALRLSFGLATK
jgi:hypothetical protein